MMSIESVMESAQLACCDAHGHIEPKVLLDVVEQKRRGHHHLEETTALLDAMPQSSTPDACVYLIEGAGLIKIGTTTNVTARIQTLRMSSPVELTLLATLPGDIAAERYLHGVFATERRHGEWFVLTPRLLRFVVFAVQRLSEHVEAVA